jgi:hypothetical protein
MISVGWFRLLFSPDLRPNDDSSASECFFGRSTFGPPLIIVGGEVGFY